MLVDDPREHWRIAGAIPRSFRINDGNGTSFADAKTVGLGAEDTALVGEAQLLQPALQEPPGLLAPFPVAALGLRLIAAQEDVPPRNRHADLLGDFPQRVG